MCGERYRERERINSHNPQEGTASKMQWQSPHGLLPCLRNVKAAALEVSQGELYTASAIPAASFSLLWASAL